jgi:hypothetical protein
MYSIGNSPLTTIFANEFKGSTVSFLYFGDLFVIREYLGLPGFCTFNYILRIQSVDNPRCFNVKKNLCLAAAKPQREINTSSLIVILIVKRLDRYYPPSFISILRFHRLVERYSITKYSRSQIIKVVDGPRLRLLLSC